MANGSGGCVGAQEAPQSPYVSKLASALSDFNNSLASSRTGSLAQIWLPEPADDGGIVLNTQGLPYSINGVGDLLALFRCISCKYKFVTDLSKPQQMGAVGRVFTSGEPEMSNHVQRYDQHVYLRAAEAQRCRVHSTLFMPLYATAARDSCLGVFEVVLTDPDVNFAGMVGWIISCLQSQGLYTAEVDTGSLADQRMGLRHVGPECDGVSALESGIAPRLEGLRGKEDGNGVAGSVVLPTMKRKGPGGEAEAGEAGGMGAGEAAKHGPALQRLASGLVPHGLPSPSPQQQQIGGGGSGSGGGSGAQQQQTMPGGGGSGGPAGQQHAAQQAAQQGQGSHRLSGSLEGRPGLVGSGGSLANALHGSALHSGSGGGLPSGSTAQQLMSGAAQGAGSDPQAVAVAMAQLLQQNANLGGGFGAPQQLAALLSAHGMQQPVAGLSNGLGTGPNSIMNGTLGPSPSVTAGLAAAAAAVQQQQTVQQAVQQAVQAQHAAQQAVQQAVQAQLANGEAQQDDDMDDETEEEDKPFLRPAPGAAKKYGQGNRILTYDDLAAQFGYGLKEAASRLNICPTTLKRACRRLGVPRWPRREIVKHKRQKQTHRTDVGYPMAQTGQQAQQNGSAPAKGFSSNSGPSSGGTGGNHMQVLTQQPTVGMARPASSSLLNGLPGMDGMHQPLLPVPSPAAPAGLAPELAAAIANSLQQQAQQQALQATPAFVSQVVALLQQQQGPGSAAPSPAGPLPANGGLPMPPPGLPHGNGTLSQLPLPVPLSLPPLAATGLPPRSSALPPAPLLSNLGLPRKADSKMNQSVGPGMGSLDILAAADFEMSVGNMSVGNSPRIALSNLGGLSNLGLSGFDFNAGGNGPAATATGGGGATGPQNGPAVSSGAVSRPPAGKQG